MNKEFFIDLANKLEGYKTRLKELHWASPSHSLHVITDDFSEELGNFEDALIENAIAITDFIFPGELNPILPEAKDFITYLEDLRGVLVSIKREAGDSIMYSGIINRVDDFFEVVNKYIYLAKLTRHDAAK